MPITFQFHPEANLVIAAHMGAVPDEEFLSSYKALYEDPRFDLASDQLIDLRQADSSKRSAEALQAFAAFATEKRRDTTARPRIAMVAPKALSFGLARMYEVFGESTNAESMAFRTADEALAWLGLPADLADRLAPKVGSEGAPATE